MSVQESTEVAPGTVVTVVQKGYVLNGRVLRPAMVIVAKRPAEDGGARDGYSRLEIMRRASISSP